MGSLALVQQSVLGKKNSKFKPVVLCLKIDLVSHSVEGLGKYTLVVKNKYFSI